MKTQISDKALAQRALMIQLLDVATKEGRAADADIAIVALKRWHDVNCPE